MLLLDMVRLPAFKMEQIGNLERLLNSLDVYVDRDKEIAAEGGFQFNPANLR